MRPFQQGQLPSIMPTCSASSRPRSLGSRMIMSPCSLFSRCSSPVMLASLPSCDTKNLATTWAAEGAENSSGDHHILSVWHLTSSTHACTLSGMWDCLNGGPCRALRIGLSRLLDVECDEACEEPCWTGTNLNGLRRQPHLCLACSIPVIPLPVCMPLLCVMQGLPHRRLCDVR